MGECFRLRHADQRTVAVLSAVSAVLLCWNTSVGKQEMLEPKHYQFRVDLNTATRGELQTLPGIGPKLAERIIQYRDEHYPLQHFDEIMNVQGIGPKRYAAIKPYFTDSK
jgi:competence protein ComEA